MNKDEAIQIIKKYEWLEEKVDELALRVAEINGYSSGWKIDEIEIRTDFIWVRFRYDYSCEPDYVSFTFPLSYLWDEDWMEKEKAAIEKEKEKKKQEYTEQQKRLAEEKEKRERAQLERLKAKYEKGD